MRVQANGALHIGSGSHHIRFQYGEINGDNNPSGIGMPISGSGPYLEVLYSRLHGAGGNSGKGCADPYGCYGAYYAGHHSLWGAISSITTGGMPSISTIRGITMWATTSSGTMCCMGTVCRSPWAGRVWHFAGVGQ